MKKYIIKNCPALIELAKQRPNGNAELEKDVTNLCYENTLLYCRTRTDCLLKRIVELCKDAQDECSCKIRNYVKCFECTSGGRAALGKEILELLEIEECE